MELKSYIREIPDFPNPGILFRDITPLLKDVNAFRYVIDRLLDQFQDHQLDVIVAIESRGFLFGAPLAYKMGIPIVPARKPGKLPAATHKAEYTLEYGKSTMEIHADAVGPGQRVLLLDDLLATGGTLEASARLVEMSGGVVQDIGVIIELIELGGRRRLEGYEIFSLVQY
jgi:adenine phosphoribosyltransferase